MKPINFVDWVELLEKKGSAVNLSLKKMNETSGAPREWHSRGKPNNKSNFSFFIKKKSGLVDWNWCNWLSCWWLAAALLFMKANWWISWAEQVSSSLLHQWNPINQTQTNEMSWFVEFDLIDFSSFLLLLVMSRRLLSRGNISFQRISFFSISVPLGIQLNWREEEINFVFSYLNQQWMVCWRRMNGLWLEPKPITVYSVIKNLWFLWRRQPKATIHSIQQTKETNQLLSFFLFSWNEMNGNKKESIITVFTVSTETSIKLGE